MPKEYRRYHKLLKAKIVIAIFFSGLAFNSASAQNAAMPDPAGFDEVSAYFNVLNIDNTELNALIKDEKAWLPVDVVFDFLKILNKPSISRDSLSGFFITESGPYLIDRVNSKITYKGKVYEIAPGGLFKYGGSLYLQTDYFGKIFGINCNFNFRSLSVNLLTDLELPILRDARLNRDRNNALRGGSNVKIDTLVKRTYPLFKFGMADWSVVNTTITSFGSDTRVGLGLGAVLVGGETNVNLNYSTANHFDRRSQFYSWRLANNDNTALRQVVLGKIFTQSISSVFAPILGATFTNTPTTFRRAYGTYTLTNTTYPNWLVELYINNVLIGFVRTDAAGLYTFQVPLVYGTSQIKLKFYGPSGEERFTEQNISIPYTFLPKHEFEYNVTGGVVDDTTRARFARLTTNYGLSSRLSIGGGLEYLSRAPNFLDTINNDNTLHGYILPYITSSARLFKNILVSAEYDHNVRTKAIISYNLFSGLQLEYNDIWYKRGQTAILNGFLEERKATVSIPFRTRSFAAFMRLTADQIILPQSSYATVSWLVSSAVGRFIGTVNTFGILVKSYAPSFYSNFSFSTTLYRKLLFTQQLQFDYRYHRVVNFKDQIETQFSNRGYINFSLENDLNVNQPTIEVGLRYFLGAAQTSASTRANKAYTVFTQSASGSVIVDPTTKYLSLKSYPNVGRGGIIVQAFLDLNNNGIKDKDEPKAAGIVIRSVGGRLEQNLKDTSVVITGLEPYTNFILDLDPLGFENISWKLKKHVYGVAIDPNQLKVVSVPVTVTSEVSGRVIYNTKDGDEGLGRVIIGFYNLKGKLLARTTTEQDGYYTYLGLNPGDYEVKIDAGQLKELKIYPTPDTRKFHIKQTIEGDNVDGLDFMLRPVAKEDVKKE